VITPDALGEIRCNITDITVPVRDINWEYDGGQKIGGNQISGPYTTSYEVSVASSKAIAQGLSLIRAGPETK